MNFYISKINNCCILCKDKIDVYIINKNHPTLIDKSIRLFEKNFKDDHYLTIVDVSDDMYSEEVFNITVKYNIGYVRLIKNGYDPTKDSISDIIGNKLNFIIDNIIKNRGCKYFGFVQQDLYLIEELSIRSVLEEHGIFTRLLSIEDTVKYIWDGLFFLEYEKFNNIDYSVCGKLTFDELKNNYNFSTGIDTYNKYIKNIDCDILDKIDITKLYPYWTFNLFDSGYNGDLGLKHRKEESEMIGPFLHTQSGSGWYDNNDKDLLIKNEIISNYLDASYDINSEPYIEVLEEVNINMNPEDKNRVDICVNNFGSPFLIKEHIRLTNKYMKDPFYYTLFDCTTDENEYIEIKNICIENNIPLIRYRVINKYKYHLLVRLASKYNYMVHKYMFKRNCKYGGILQQDMFMIRDTSVKHILDNTKIIGRTLDMLKSNNVNYKGDLDWYVWEGCIFFVTKDVKFINFHPNSCDCLRYDNTKPIGECGIKNYYTYLKYMNRDEVEMYKHEGLYGDGLSCEKIYKVSKDSDIANNKCVVHRLETMEYLNNFIHGWGSGNWDGRIENSEKNILLVEYLKRY